MSPPDEDLHLTRATCHHHLKQSCSSYQPSTDYLLCRTELREHTNKSVSDLHLNDDAIQILTDKKYNPEASNDTYINGLLLLFCKNLEMKITQLSVEEKQTLKEIFSRSKPAKEHRKRRRRKPKL